MTFDESSTGAGPSIDRVVATLINAIDHLDGLDQLGHDDLGALADVLEPWPGPIGDFAIRCRSAWEIVRPPADTDLAELAGEDNGIDWLDDEADDLLAEYDDETGDLAHDESDEGDSIALTVAMAEARRLPTGRTAVAA